MKTTWTEARLQRLYQVYNRRYWNGKLPRYSIRIERLAAEDQGICDRRRHRILIDPEHHRSDRGVRSTLLHEMVHIKGGDEHGNAFLAGAEWILGQGAQLSLVGAVRYSTNIPLKYPLCRKALVRGHRADLREHPLDLSHIHFTDRTGGER